MSDQETQAATSEAQAASTATITPVNDYVNMKEEIFHFKTDKDTVIKNDAGETVETVKGVKHPSVKVHLPIPKPSRLIEFLTDTTEKFAKERDLLLTAVSNVVFSVARGQINDFREKDPKGTVTPAVINYDKLDFTAIANMPKSERGSYVPSDEDNQAFLDAYLSLMPAITDKEPGKIKNHVDIIATGFKKQRAQKDILEFFQDAIGMFVVKAPADVVEEHMDVIEYYQNKLARMLKVEEKITMDDL